jgi:hypothetical protein
MIIYKPRPCRSVGDNAVLTKFSVMTLHGNIVYFTSAATIRKRLEVLLQNIKVRKGQRDGRNEVKDEDTKEIISRRIPTVPSHYYVRILIRKERRIIASAVLSVFQQN